MKRQPTQQQLQHAVNDFNLIYKVGEMVNVKNDDGSISNDIIRYPASIMGGHTAMAWLEYRGSYLLERVSKV